MQQFVQIGRGLVNKDRLLAVQHNPAQKDGVFISQEHYLAIFDGGEKVWLSPEEGQDLISQCHGAGIIGTTATTSDSAM